MRALRLVWVVSFVVAAFGAASAEASPDALAMSLLGCPDDDGDDAAHPQAQPERDDDVEARGEPKASDRVLVPCGLVESGLLGADCADADFYVVTNGGVTLCEVDVSRFLVQDKSPQIERASVPAAFSPLGTAVGLLPSEWHLGAPLVTDQGAGVPAHAPQARDAHLQRFPRPS